MTKISVQLQEGFIVGRGSIAYCNDTPIGIIERVNQDGTAIIHINHRDVEGVISHGMNPSCSVGCMENRNNVDHNPIEDRLAALGIR